MPLAWGDKNSCKHVHLEDASQHTSRKTRNRTGEHTRGHVKRNQHQHRVSATPLLAEQIIATHRTMTPCKRNNTFFTKKKKKPRTRSHTGTSASVAFHVYFTVPPASGSKSWSANEPQLFCKRKPCSFVLRFVTRLMRACYSKWLVDPSRSYNQTSQKTFADTIRPRKPWLLNAPWLWFPT